MTPLILQIYSEALSDLTDDQFTRAVKWLMKNHEYPSLPLPAHIFKAVVVTREQIYITPKENRIEQHGVPCPQEVKEMMRETLLRISLSYRK